MSEDPTLTRPPLGAPVSHETERELRALLGDLFEHSEVLLRQEVELGKAELHLRVEKGKQALRRGAISAGLFYAAYLTTLTTLVLVLCQWMMPWLAALIVAVVASGGAVVFSLLGKQALDDAKHPSLPHTSTPHMSSRSLTRERAHS